MFSKIYSMYTLLLIKNICSSFSLALSAYSELILCSQANKIICQEKLRIHLAYKKQIGGNLIYPYGDSTICIALLMCDISIICTVRLCGMLDSKGKKCFGVNVTSAFSSLKQLQSLLRIMLLFYTTVARSKGKWTCTLRNWQLFSTLPFEWKALHSPPGEVSMQQMGTINYKILFLQICPRFKMMKLVMELLQ